MRYKSCVLILSLIPVLAAGQTAGRTRHKSYSFVFGAAP
jgi:hypothetical protein